MQAQTATKRKLALGFGLILVLLSINAAVSYNHMSRLVGNMRRVTRTYQVLDELNSRFSLLKDAETGMNRYIISGQTRDLKPYYTVTQRIATEVDPLDEQLWDDTTQRLRVIRVETQITRRLSFIRKAISLRRTRGFRPAQQFVIKNTGRQMADMSMLVGQMQDEQRLLLQRRSRESEASATASILTISVAALANLLLVMFVWALLARTEVQRGKLAQAYRDLKRADEMRDSLTAMLVHDLRTPLTTMIGSLEMLKGEEGEAIDARLRQEMVAMSAQGGYRLLGLVNQLLDISKMESGQMKIRRELVQVPNLIEEALNQVTRLDLGETTRITRQIASDLPPLLADPELLTRVLVNLIGNALKFTPATGTITIGAKPADATPAERDGATPPPVPTQHLSTQSLGSPNHSGASNTPSAILFCVQDTGEGIPKEELGRIFDKFGQVESRKAGHQMSTGLGLTFCRLAVEAHGGLIWVESELGQGSTFFFTIPLNP